MHFPKKNNHQLHKKIGKRINKRFQEEFPDYEIILSNDCGGKQKIPLFCSNERKKDTKYCEIDLLIIKNNIIKVILEIEESGITPIKIFGKFLTSALSSNYIYESKNCEMDKHVTFIQILGTNFKDKCSKNEQIINIKKSMQNIIPVQDKIHRYELIFEDISDFGDRKLDEIFEVIREVLK